MECYTKQYCPKCGKTIKIDALYFLMSLENIEKVCICDECKITVNSREGEKNNEN